MGIAWRAKPIYNRRFCPTLASDRQSGQEAGRPTKCCLATNSIESKIMKKEIHPEYRDVVFHDLSCDFKFVTRSTINTRDKIEHEGKEYPLIKIEVSAESHPFFTGKHKIVDTAGRVEKFRQKFGAVGSKTSVANG
jgi:large subunit ribosomal protein L31